ncbi:C2 family cysteine protease [Streptomyces sp. NPDC048606]|uniref:C2 family cysteine protease n=1 Tax=Streptomyces sp. NPDC048606 TaxID=3154726 RepID=UPI0034233545
MDEAPDPETPSGESAPNPETPSPNEAPTPETPSPDEAPNPEASSPEEPLARPEGPADPDEAPDPAPAETEAPPQAGPESEGAPEAPEAPEEPIPAGDGTEAPDPDDAATDDGATHAPEARDTPSELERHDPDEAPDPPAAEADDLSAAGGSTDAPVPDEPERPSAAPAPEDELVEHGVFDRLKQFTGSRKRDTDRSEQPVYTVDHPEFQDPLKRADEVPDRYGNPLDRSDGTRMPLFDGDPARDQITQGRIGDCGIIATLGAVATHHPDAIRACVTEMPDGNYGVSLHEARFNYSRDRFEPTGRKIDLIVTPDVPVFDEASHQPAFAKSGATEAVWGPVMEKAIAGSDQVWDQERRDRWAEIQKVRKVPDVPEGYVRLNRGSGPSLRAELLTQLTGRPAVMCEFPNEFDHDGRSPDKQLMSDLKERLAEGKPVLVGTQSKLDHGGPLENDLHPAHAYEVTEVDGQGKIHLWNPWNRFHPEPLTLKQFRDNIRPVYSTLE